MNTILTTKKCMNRIYNKWSFVDIFNTLFPQHINEHHSHDTAISRRNQSPIPPPIFFPTQPWRQSQKPKKGRPQSWRLWSPKRQLANSSHFLLCSSIVPDYILSAHFQTNRTYFSTANYVFSTVSTHFSISGVWSTVYHRFLFGLSSCIPVFRAAVFFFIPSRNFVGRWF